MKYFAGLTEQINFMLKYISMTPFCIYLNSDGILLEQLNQAGFDEI